MSFIRSTSLRASSLARCARPTRYIRTAELQPWQRTLQRRAYASAHGSHAKKSDLPWIAASLSGTVVGLYFVLNQDLSHGEDHGDEHHDAAHEKHKEEHEGSADEHQEDAKSEDSEEPKQDEKEESKVESREDKNKKDQDDKISSPDQRDEPSPRKGPNSQNEISGKQEGMSNSDTKHPAQIHDDPQKSKKGEGVAESAKLKGTVSTERPGAENKEEQGKAQLDKDK